MLTSQRIDVLFLKWLTAVLFGLLAILSVANLTTSSIGLHVAGDAENSAEVLVGNLRPIRTDEWKRGTPVLLGTFVDGWSDEALTPFEERDVRFGWLGQSVLPAIISPERALVSLLPARMGFFAYLWMAPLMCIWSVASLLSLLGLNRLASVGGGVATALGPASAWWSFHGAELMWPATLATVLLILSWKLTDYNAPRWRRTTGVLSRLVLPVVGGVLLARYPLAYAPWSLPIAGIAGALIVDLWWAREDRRRSLKPILVMGATSILFAALRMASLAPRLSSLLGTVYPGSRRSSGGSEGMPIFTGVFTYLAQTSRGSVMAFSNLSETALGPLAIVVAALFVSWASKVSAHSMRRSSLTLTTISVVTLFSWALFSWPSVLLRFNPFTVVPGYRVAQILGVAAIPFVWLAVHESGALLIRSRRTSLALGGGLIVLVLSARDEAVYRTIFPLVTPSATWFWILSYAVAFAIFVSRPSRAITSVPLACLIVVSALTVNPIVRGVGDLYDSRSAITIRENVGGTREQRVASDDLSIDALLIANAIPTLGGQMNYGPDKDSWKLLDPTEKYEAEWNRGAATLQFSWNPDAVKPMIVSPYPDMVVVEVNPCSSLLEWWNVTWVISTERRSESCLVERAEFYWFSSPRWLYQVQR